MFKQHGESSHRMMNICNQIQKLWNFSGRDIISDYEYLLSNVNAFTVNTGKYYSNCNNVNDAKGLQILYHYCSSIILRLEVTSHKYWLILTRGFYNEINLHCCCAVYCWNWLKVSQIIHRCYILRANKFCQNLTCQLKVKIA